MSDNLEKEKIETIKSCIEKINQIYFCGVMSLSWYSDIDKMFNVYGFSREVIEELFKYCNDKNKLNNNYVLTVAESWHNSKIKTNEDLKEFLENKKAKNIIDSRIENIIKNMINYNIDIETISKITEISIEEIKEIKNRIK
ncbi:MAG: DnaD domain protein [Bacilli bacterium]|jgi:DnaD/phage-associated family protein